MIRIKTKRRISSNSDETRFLFIAHIEAKRYIRTHFFHGAKVLILETNNPCTNLSYINLFNSSTSLNTVVEDTACDGGVLPNSANIFLALDMASG